LRAGGETGRLDAVDRGGDVPRDEGGVGAERPHPDHGVAWVGVDVGHGGDDDVGADRGDATADLVAGGAGGRDVVEGAELRRAGQRRAGAGLETGDTAALLVDADQRVRGEAVDLVAERSRVAVEVLREVHHPGEPGGQRLGQPV